MRLVEVWRYPVKSMGGERLASALIGPTGIEHDRGWGVVDTLTGNVLTARREPGLLMLSARVDDGELVVTTSDGERLDHDVALSDHLGRPVRLEAAGDTGGVYENPFDVEHETDWMSWQGPGGAWHDSTRTRVSMVSTATLAAVGTPGDVRRFRMNLVLDGHGEDDLIGSTATLGEVGLRITKAVDRCVMVTRPQPGLGRDLDLLRTINRDRAGTLGIGALVDRGGTVAIGDELETTPG